MWLPASPGEKFQAPELYLMRILLPSISEIWGLENFGSKVTCLGLKASGRGGGSDRVNRGCGTCGGCG